MKEGLENWKVHLDKLCELSRKQLEDHATKAIIALMNERSWKNTSRIRSGKWGGNTYPHILETLHFESDQERLTATKFLNIFFISLSFYRFSIEKQNKELQSEYRIATKRLKDLEDLNELIKTLSKRLKREKIFLNYYTNFLDQNSELRNIKELDSTTLELFVKDSNYLGWMSDESLEFEEPESRIPTVLEKFSKDLKELNELLDPVFFQKLHLNQYRNFHLSELKWRVTHNLVQTFKNPSQKGENQTSPWKFISDYFEVFFTIATLQDDFPTDFDPKNLQSKYRSVKKASKS